jgi:hypothetical protein
MQTIPLTRDLVTLVDDEDYDLVMQWRWQAQPHYRTGRTYARRVEEDAAGTRHTVLLHRFLMSPPEGMQVDHINRDSLDNRRSNLRLCTPSENARNNRSRRRYKGVYHQNNHTRPFQAKINCAGEMHHLGYFQTEEEGARAYDEKARELFGAFACLNFPDEGTRHSVSRLQE